MALREADASWGRPWNAVEVGPRRDLLGDLTGAVRRKGLRMGFYFSLYEWYNPLWLSENRRYVEQHMFPQFKDLVTRYKPSIIFSDGEWELPSEEWRSPELLAWLFNDSPVKEGGDQRSLGEDPVTSTAAITLPNTAGPARLDHPWEESRGMGFLRLQPHGGLDHYRTGRKLLIMLIDPVSRGGNLLLNIGPTADGPIPVVMEDRLAQMGRWLQINGEAIYGTRPGRRRASGAPARCRRWTTTRRTRPPTT